MILLQIIEDTTEELKKDDIVIYPISKPLSSESQVIHLYRYVDKL